MQIKKLDFCNLENILSKHNDVCCTSYNVLSYCCTVFCTNLIFFVVCCCFQQHWVISDTTFTCGWCLHFFAR